MRNYKISLERFDKEGNLVKEIIAMEAVNAGQAFYKVLKLYPKAIITEAYREGKYLDGYGITTYKMISVKKPKPLRAEKREQAHLDL